MIRKLFILFILLRCFTISKAAPVKIDVTFIDHEKLLSHNFDPRSYANYQQAFQDSVIDYFSEFKQGQNVRIIQTFDPNLYPLYSFSAKPVLVDSVQHQLQKLLMSIRSISSLYMSFTSEIIVTINGGCKDRGLDYTPILKNPLLLRQSKYEYGSFKQSFDFLKDWLENSGMPLLIDIHNSNVRHQKIELTEDEKKAFSTVKFGILNTTHQDYLNTSFYWQVLRKMKIDYKTLMVFRAMAAAYDGRIQHAQALLQMIYQFESSNTLLLYIMDEFNWRMNYYLQKEQGLLQSIGKTFNEQTLSQDLQLLEDILKINYMSQPALTRLFKIERASGQKSPFLVVTRGDYIRSNPSSMDTVVANSPFQAYRNGLISEAADLFIDAETFEDDFPKYADISLKLKDYEFAAELYWMLTNQPLGNSEKDVANYRFRHEYALHKLNPNAPIDKKLKKQFKRLDKKFRKEMKKHPRYKKFKK